MVPLKRQGLPADLDLSFLRGAELVRVCLETWVVHLHFDPPASVRMDADWELADDSGKVIDRSSDIVRQHPFQLHLLLGRLLEEAEVSTPLSYELRFSGGLVLRVFIGSQGYDPTCIQPGKNVV